MEDQSAERHPHTKEEKPEFYKKDKGAITIHGQIFEYLFSALVYLRATNQRWKFKLASNVRGFRPFDDAVLEYLDDNFRKSHIFVQLKSKMTQRITMQQLLADTGDFSLRKYCESYIQIEEKFNCKQLGAKMDGSVDDSLFILYTNADIPPELQSNKDTDIGEEKLLMTGGNVLQFNEQEHKVIYDNLKDLPKHREFLSRFRLFYSQAEEKQMDLHIKTALQKSMQLPESELDIAYMYFRDLMKEWWQHKQFFLKETNSRENDPLRKTSEKVSPILIAKIMEQRKSKLQNLSIKYEESAITNMKQLINPHKAVLIFAPGCSTTLTAAKIHQMLRASKHVILTVQQLILYKTDIMLAWKSMFDVLVLESRGTAEVSTDLFNEISGFMNESFVEKKFIFISSRVGIIKKIYELTGGSRIYPPQVYDDFKLTDIVHESRLHLLHRKVYFQGVEVELSKIVKNEGVCLLSALDYDSISLLLKNGKPSIGISIVDTVKCYIDRTLQLRKHDNTRLPTQGEIQHAPRVNSLQEMRDSFPHLKENLGSETSTCWKPRTLFEGDSRIILVTDEPGMGKSTLLTHLAEQTRLSHTEMWIVRVNINNYTRILDELKTNGCDEKGATKLLTKAAGIKEAGGVVLERRLFEYTYNSTGNMAVLIDGVDEVSPHYTEEIVQLLKILSQTKIKKIWVTSRNSLKDRLEKEFQCQSYSLVPFNEEDQKRFQVKFWKQTCPEIEDDYLDNLANQVVKLSTEQLNVEDKKFMGIPLQSLLLGEMFEGNLKEYSTSSTVELPEHINVVMLYKLYVEKKWGIYIQEKKGSDQTKVMVIDDDAKLQKIFIKDHMAAALVEHLSKQQLEKLADRKIGKRASKFLKKISEGDEKTGIITEVTDGRPVFQHRTLAEYLVARWLCDNFQKGQIFMRDHLFEAEFCVVRSMVDRILAYRSSLHEAVLNCNMNQVEKLLQKNEYVTEKDRGGRTPLHVAVSCSSPELIQLFLEHGADVSSVDTLMGFSPVQYALGMADWEMLSLVMEKRPDVREKVLNGVIRDCTDNIACALRAVAQYGHNELLEYLIKNESCVNMTLPGDNSNLIHIAARCQKTETVRLLLLLGASIDCQDESGKTPLHVSVETRNLEIIKCLVEHQETVRRESDLQHVVKTERTLQRGSFLNVPDKDGNTPLHLGVAKGNMDVVSYLLSAGSDLNTCNVQGADVNAMNSANQTPLRIAASRGQTKILELLFEHNATLSLQDKDGITALLAASMNGYHDTMLLILQHGGNIEDTDRNGNTIAHFAVQNENLDILNLLSQRNVSLDVQNSDGDTPLLQAVREGRNRIVQYLVERNCDINTQAKDGMRPLDVAVLKGNMETTRILLERNASSGNANVHIVAAARFGFLDLLQRFVARGDDINMKAENGESLLHVACKSGHVATVQYLCEHGPLQDWKDNNGNTAVHVAAQSGHKEICRVLLNSGASVNAEDKNRKTPLVLAAEIGGVETVRELLKDTAVKNLWTPLLSAVTEGHTEVVRELLKRGAAVNIANETGATPLSTAAEKGYVEIVTELLNYEASVNSLNTYGSTPLMIAATNGHVEVVTVLLNNGAMVDITDKFGNSPLTYAAAKGQVEVVRELLNRTSRVNIRDKLRRTPLSIAAAEGHVEVVRELLNRNARVYSRDYRHRTPLNLAAAKGHVEVVRELLKHGAAVDSKDVYGSTPLKVAAAEGHVQVVTELLNSGATVDSTDFIERTPLSMAAVEGHVEVVRELLNRGATVDIRDVSRRTPLRVAASKGHVEVVRELLNSRADVGSVDKDGRTPLSVAAAEGHVEVVRELLNRGAALDRRDNEKRTPLSVAAAKGHVEVVRELLNRGAALDGRDNEERTPLSVAAAEGHVEVVTELLNRGAALDSRDNEERTPLSVAEAERHVEVFRVLANRGAALDSRDNEKRTPLVVATTGHEEVIK